MENIHPRVPWNKGKLIGQKSPLKLREFWAIRNYLELGRRLRDLALFNLGIDSKLRGCDLTSPRVRDVAHGNVVLSRAIVMHSGTPNWSRLSDTWVSRSTMR
jgi:hypothetical protein